MPTERTTASGMPDDNSTQISGDNSTQGGGKGVNWCSFEVGGGLEILFT